MPNESLNEDASLLERPELVAHGLPSGVCASVNQDEETLTEVQGSAKQSISYQELANQGPVTTISMGSATYYEVVRSDGDCEKTHEDYDQAFRNARLIIDVFEDMGAPVGKQHKILDFGTGDGAMVYALRKLGYNAFGTDIVCPSPNVRKRLSSEGLCNSGKIPLTVIEASHYRLPYEDDSFDFVVSIEVMEHVRDHNRAFAEIKRVLKPGGKSFHYFPARYYIIEPHVSVPFASIFQGTWYLYFWALIGFRRESDRGKPAAEVARKNCEYLREFTKYLQRKDLEDLVKGLFGNISFVSHYVWKHSDGIGGTVYKRLCRYGMQKLIPLVASLVSRFRRWAIFFVKPEN